MKEVFYKCTFLSDVILNSSLATSGSVQSLSYIPGSNFLGIAASRLYSVIDDNAAYSFFHSGRVRFGDATISRGNELSFAIPLNVVKPKDSIDEEGDFYLKGLASLKRENGDKVQFKSINSGFLFNNGGRIAQIRKRFTLHNSIDRETGSSKDGGLFGFESIQKGQDFIFSIQYDFPEDFSVINSTIVGNHYIGKSKSAEFGSVVIEEIEEVESIEFFENDKGTWVYVQSNLFLLDEYGNAKCKIEASDLGFESGYIDWTKSQVRKFEYSSWNFKRNTHNASRLCIAPGSVFFVTGAFKTGKNNVGEFQAEGLGKVLYNPAFLASDNFGRCNFNYGEKKIDIGDVNALNPSIKISSLISYVSSKYETKQKELLIAKRVFDFVYSDKYYMPILSTVTRSQWGVIRSCAFQSVNMSDLIKKLFGTIERTEDSFKNDLGVLTHGISFQKYWGANGARRLSMLWEFLNLEETQLLGPLFIERLAAEIAKNITKK